MRGLTKTTLWEFLIVLQEKAKYNVSEMRKNVEKIRDYQENLLRNDIESKDLIKRLKIKNHELSKENHMLISLHNSILQINEKEEWFSKEEIKQVGARKEPLPKTLSKNECVQMVLNGDIKITEDSTYLNDEEILDNVYKELIKTERYEDCEALKKRKDKLKEKRDLSCESQGMEVYRLFRISAIKRLIQKKTNEVLVFLHIHKTGIN
jgi:hypothetical protein